MEVVALDILNHVKKKLIDLGVWDSHQDKPTWFEQLTLYWQQKFLATKELHVQQTFPTLNQQQTRIKKNTRLPYCQNTSELQSELAKHRLIQSTQLYLKNHLNWARPIKTFTLRVHSNTQQVPLVCWPYPLKQKHSKELLFHANDFDPQADLYLYFLS